jgi:hypothetical protein
MSTITFATINTAIITGDLDESLDFIKHAIKTREEMLQGQLKRSLSIGDKVKFNDQTTPIYMRGMVATIIKINRERVVVNMDNPTGRFRNNVTVPFSLLEKV